MSNVNGRRDRRAGLSVGRRRPLPKELRHLRWPGPRKISTVATLLAVAAVTMASTVPARSAGLSATQVGVDGIARHQRIDGFGFAEAFQRSNILHGSLGLSPANQRRVLDLLFSTRNGAGFSMLRLGIGSSPGDTYDLMQSIEPVSPGSPTAAPDWVWDGSVVVELLNTTSTATQADVALQHLGPRGPARPYLTDAANMVTPQPPVPVHGGKLVLPVPPRSVVTLLLPR